MTTQKLRSRRGGTPVHLSPYPRPEGIPRIGTTDFFDRLERIPRPYQTNYYAMYSSIPDGITTDPRLMTVPFDDHMVNRGDGVFEILPCIDGALYNYHAHLRRLMVSAQTLKLALPCERDSIIGYIAETIRAGGRRDCTVRVNISRGPGGFSIDPAEAVAPQLYIAAFRLPPPFTASRAGGAKARIFAKPLSPPTRPVIKSCNYLFNVLMKMEASAHGADFSIACDKKGNLADGATESLAWVSQRGEFLLPGQRHILRGTTAGRAKILARKLVRSGMLSGVRHANLSRRAVRQAAEIMLLGSTIRLAPVIELNGIPVGNGRPGPVAKALDRALERDMRLNPSMRISVF